MLLDQCLDLGKWSLVNKVPHTFWDVKAASSGVHILYCTVYDKL